MLIGNGLERLKSQNSSFMGWIIYRYTLIFIVPNFFYYNSHFYAINSNMKEDEHTPVFMIYVPGRNILLTSMVTPKERRDLQIWLISRDNLHYHKFYLVQPSKSRGFTHS